MMYVARRFFLLGLPAKPTWYPLLGVNTPAKEIISVFAQERKFHPDIPQLLDPIRRAF